MNNENSTTEPSQNDITNETDCAFLRSRCSGIYGLQNKLEPDKWYIGKGGGKRGIRGRWYSYSKLRCKSQPKLYDALTKYGYDGFNKVIIELCSEEHLSEREEYWRKKYKSIENGYNCIVGGKSNISEESRQKMRLAKLGKNNPNYNGQFGNWTKSANAEKILEWKENLSSAHTYRNSPQLWTEEYRKQRQSA